MSGGGKWMEMKIIALSERSQAVTVKTPLTCGSYIFHLRYEHRTGTVREEERASGRGRESNRGVELLRFFLLGWRQCVLLVPEP